ncbi:hypothetical protein [Aerosakkonema funiforme]|uniref:hypothetical protein n=1 Tax=Oscillatoriophycideae TaxID=1301283 RepID=UPI002AC889DE|nr:hypothetical protein [Aerosakkonema funiforme]
MAFNLEPYRGITQFLLDWCITSEQIPQEFLPAIIQGIKLAAGAGLGECKPVINLRLLLIDGFYHAVDSRARSYQVASELAVRAAFEQVGLIPIS